MEGHCCLSVALRIRGVLLFTCLRNALIPRGCVISPPWPILCKSQKVQGSQKCPLWPEVSAHCAIPREARMGSGDWTLPLALACFALCFWVTLRGRSLATRTECGQKVAISTLCDSELVQTHGQKE